MKKTRRGFTLVELLVATTLGAIVTLGALRVVNNLYQSQRTARKISELLNATEPLFNQLTQDIHWAQSYDLNGNTLFLFDHNQDPIASYRIDGDALLRNNDPLFEDNIRLTHFDVTNRAPASQLPLLEISLGLEHQSQQGSQATLDTKTTISMRQSEQMEP